MVMIVHGAKFDHDFPLATWFTTVLLPRSSRISFLQENLLFGLSFCSSLTRVEMDIVSASLFFQRFFDDASNVLALPDSPKHHQHVHNSTFHDQHLFRIASEAGQVKIRKSEPGKTQPATQGAWHKPANSSSHSTTLEPDTRDTRSQMMIFSSYADPLPTNGTTSGSGPGSCVQSFIMFVGGSEVSVMRRWEAMMT